EVEAGGPADVGEPGPHLLGGRARGAPPPAGQGRRAEQEQEAEGQGEVSHERLPPGGFFSTLTTAPLYTSAPLPPTRGVASDRVRERRRRRPLPSEPYVKVALHTAQADHYPP